MSKIFTWTHNALFIIFFVCHVFPILSSLVRLHEILKVPYLNLNSFYASEFCHFLLSGPLGNMCCGSSAEQWPSAVNLFLLINRPLTAFSFHALLLASKHKCFPLTPILILLNGPLRLWGGVLFESLSFSNFSLVHCCYYKMLLA